MKMFKKTARDILNAKIVGSFIYWLFWSSLEHCIIAKHIKLILDKMVINLEQIQFDLCKTELVPCLVVGFFPNSLFGKCIDVLFIVICELQVIHRKISNKKKKKRRYPNKWSWYFSLYSIAYRLEKLFLPC